LLSSITLSYVTTSVTLEISFNFLTKNSLAFLALGINILSSLLTISFNSSYKDSPTAFSGCISGLIPLLIMALDVAAPIEQTFIFASALQSNPISSSLSKNISTPFLLVKTKYV